MHDWHLSAANYLIWTVFCIQIDRMDINTTRDSGLNFGFGEKVKG
ncbi:hypothetical protein FDUTEX481_02414 [Tolypothrix sp. PCC 7601]|nr:hypothetical protein FDUTEX481_02414 [Tolypothrix sp. PCC 7601]